jgi:hypothetical protein
MSAQRTTRGSGVPRLAVLAAAALTGAALPAAGLMAGPASAAPVPVCTGFPYVSCVFAPVLGGYTWAVPAGITSLNVIADGGSGADSQSTFVIGGGAGGAGGEYSAELTGIPAGTSLSVVPGSAAIGTLYGLNAGPGHGGLGGRDTHNNKSGGGGGATTVALSPFSVSNLLVVAGGGGGGAAENENGSPGPYSDGGVGGGSTTTSGANGGPGAPSTTGGHGGTPAAGGNGGAGPDSGCTTPAAGTQLFGGAGQISPGFTITCPYAGGGGGSGYYGGGGGGTGGGGGGGSAFPAGPTTVGGILVTPQPDANTNTGNGLVTIDYTVPVTSTRLRVSSVRSGGTVTLYAQLIAEPGGETIAGEPITFYSDILQFCTNVLTNASGVASCTLTPLEVGLLQDNFGVFRAYFGGDTGLPGTTAYGVANLGRFFF